MQILRLNTSTKDHTPPTPTQPTPEQQRDRDQYRNPVKSPERSELRSPGGEEDGEKQKAREDAIAALEGKKRRPSKPQRPLDDTVRFDTLYLRIVAGVGRREEDEETCTAATAVAQI
jgi:hypothetical protein